MTLPVVVLTKDGVLHLRSGHPWIYPGHLASRPPQAPCVVALEGPPGHVRGVAVCNPQSRIPLRIVARGREALDQDWSGDAWWEARLDAAVAERARLAPGETACRWVHAEADGLPGLVVDRYADVAVVQAGCAWADGIAPRLAQRLIERHGLSGVLARHEGSFRRPEGLPEGVKELAGSVPHEVRWTSHGVTRVIDPWTGQKTGAYLDQRENQAFAAQALPVGRALDAFCNDGGFALQLAKAGSRVLCLDGSEVALAGLRRNAELNGLSTDGDSLQLRVEKANVFDRLHELADRVNTERAELFDAIVLDPPALAKRKAQLNEAMRGYRELNLRAFKLLRPGGRLLTCSCSFALSEQHFLEMLSEAASDAGVDARIVERRSAAACHPRRLTFPESGYLKVALLEVTGRW
jgi:23S rRNA (cytosine1962-C5)-methyltransferase